MQFNSIAFVAFFPIVTLFYFSIPNKYRNYYLFIVNYFFYALWDIKLSILLFAITSFSYFVAIKIEKSNMLNKKQYLVSSIAVLLIILFIYKYLNASIVLFNILTGSKLNDLFILNELPLGISFYLFSIMSYLIDVYRNRMNAERNFIKYSIYVTYFLKIAQGPIEKASTFIKQLDEEHSFTWHNFFDGLLLAFWGYFLKIVLADRIGKFVDTVFADIELFGGAYLICAIVLFSIQIYADFYGYSCIAVGTSNILGIKLIDNFSQPYLSNSITDFWRKWHISLMEWFKDYVYIPLGGNKKGKIRKNINKFIVFVLSGLWHGASLSYVLWGAINGIYQIVEDTFFNNKAINNKPLNVFRIFITFILISFSWIFFRSGSLKTSFQVINSIINCNNYNIIFDGSLFDCGLDKNNFFFMLICILMLIVVDIINNRKISIRNTISEQKDIVKIAVVVFSLLFILLFGLYGPKYNKATFIYNKY